MDMREEAMDLPEAIKQKELRLLDTTEKHLVLKTVMDTTEKRVINFVLKEVGADGKKKYTNDASRKLEKEIRLKANHEYQKNHEDYNKLKKEIDEILIGIGYLKRKFRAIETVGRLNA